MASINTTFTSVNEELFLKACDLGRNEVLSLLIIAMGTTGVSAYTKWSADAISKRLKIDWRYAKAAIEHLKKAEILIDINAEANRGKRRARPSYKMNEATDHRLWYPASLFDEFINQATGEVIPSPIVRLKEVNDVNMIRFLLFLYKHQDLKNEAGIPRHILHSKLILETIAKWKRKWTICTYRHSGSNTAPIIGDMTTQDAIYQAIDANADAQGEKHWFWYYLQLAEHLGFIERAVYLFEGDDYGTSYLYPIDGTIEQEQAVAQSLSYYFIGLCEATPIPLENRVEALGDIELALEGDSTLFPLDLLLHRQAKLYEIFRLRFRPHTENTGEWFSKINTQTTTLIQSFLR